MRLPLQGGIIGKRPEWKQEGKAFLLSVEDAQQPGKDIGSGSYRIEVIQQLLAASSSTLYQSLAKHAQHAQRGTPAQQEADGWAAVQVRQHGVHDVMECTVCSNLIVMMCHAVKDCSISYPVSHHVNKHTAV